MHWRRQSKGKKINYKNWWYFFLFSSHFLRFSLLSFPVVFTFFTNFLSILSFMFPFPFYSCPCHPFFNSFLSFPKTYYFHQQKIQSTDNTPIAKEYLIMHFACNINFPFSILASKIPAPDISFLWKLDESNLMAEDTSPQLPFTVVIFKESSHQNKCEFKTFPFSPLLPIS